jgi:hypothetical protein
MLNIYIYINLLWHEQETKLQFIDCLRNIYIDDAYCLRKLSVFFVCFDDIFKTLSPKYL